TVRRRSRAVVASVALGSLVQGRGRDTGLVGDWSSGVGSSDLYTSADCTTGGVAAGSVALDSNGVADPSDAEGPLAAGSYSFSARSEGGRVGKECGSGWGAWEVKKGGWWTTTDMHDWSPKDGTQ